MRRRRLGSLSRREWLRLSAFGAAVAALHAVGWGLFFLSAHRYPALAGLGTLAYTFGLRHAFDADHIAAIDNATRKLLSQGKRPLGVGFFFSLGHSTIVLSLAAGLALAARTVKGQIPALRSYGASVGASVSGTFLCLIGILNLIVLLDIVRIYRELKRGEHDEQRLEARLHDRGFMNRFFLGRFFRLITTSWQMYPLGLLFGLGFDTATEVAFLVLAGTSVAAGLPFWAVLSLPLLFAAGMSLLDTLDGSFMNFAYGWAFSKPVRKVYYNIAITGLSVFVAFYIGTLELSQVMANQLHLTGGFWQFAKSFNINRAGFTIVGIFVAVWVGALGYWRFGRVEERWERAALRAQTARGEAAELRQLHARHRPVARIAHNNFFRINK